MSRVDDPQFDPWAGIHGAFTASPTDLTLYHDQFVAEE
jgi:hypothetical protein